MANGKIPSGKTAIYAGGPLRRSSRIIKPVKRYDVSAEVSKVAKKRRRSQLGPDVQKFPQVVTPVPRKKPKYSKSSERLNSLRSHVVPIPDDILLGIFKWLPIEDRMQCAQVSKRWRRVVFDRRLWTCVHLSWALHVNSLRKLITRCCHENTLCLKITGFYSMKYANEQENDIYPKTVTPALLAHINKTCPNLKNLELCECVLDFGDIEERHMNYSFQHLTHLTLKDNDTGVRHGLSMLLRRVVPRLHQLTFNKQAYIKNLEEWFNELSVWHVSFIDMDYIGCLVRLGVCDAANEILKPLVMNGKAGVLSFSESCYRRWRRGAVTVTEFTDWLMENNHVVKIIGLKELARKDARERYERYYANKTKDKTESKNAGPSAFCEIYKKC